MTRTTRPLTRFATPCAALALACALQLPSAAAAQTGGIAAPDTEEALVAPDGASISSRRTELLGRDLRFRGALPRVATGQPIAVQRLDRELGWQTIATAPAGSGGTYDTVWRTRHIGRQAIRAVPAQAPPEVQAASAAPLRQVTVFKPVTATFFGPGLFGEQTACGQKLTRRLQGVAHRTLPCGTKVDLLFEGRSTTVPVVDRGPFREGTTYDLTAATAKSLGMDATSRIGAVQVPKAPR